MQSRSDFFVSVKTCTLLRETRSIYYQDLLGIGFFSSLRTRQNGSSWMSPTVLCKLIKVIRNTGVQKRHDLQTIQSVYKWTVVYQVLKKRIKYFLASNCLLCGSFVNSSWSLFRKVLCVLAQQCLILLFGFCFRKDINRKRRKKQEYRTGRQSRSEVSDSRVNKWNSLNIRFKRVPWTLWSVVQM